VAQGDRGTVTAEIAVAMPAVVLLIVAVLFCGSAVVSQVRCVDAARAGARSAARGDPPGEVLAQARRLAPPGARIGVSNGGGDVAVTVRSMVTGGLPGWPGLPVGSTATAMVEQ
jgi:TadE-like protein